MTRARAPLTTWDSGTKKASDSTSLRLSSFSATRCGLSLGPGSYPASLSSSTCIRASAALLRVTMSISLGDRSSTFPLLREGLSQTTCECGAKRAWNCTSLRLPLLATLCCLSLGPGSCPTGCSLITCSRPSAARVSDCCWRTSRFSLLRAAKDSRNSLMESHMQLHMVRSAATSSRTAPTTGKTSEPPGGWKLGVAVVDTFVSLRSVAVPDELDLRPSVVWLSVNSQVDAVDATVDAEPTALSESSPLPSVTDSP
mmetsp:Transcript_4158/g.11732  ORF Transcript_4158/g.11732 Transcript_4158/m.11732 type:complete len:256 (-) Transcript_4158:131-898(-)